MKIKSIFVGVLFFSLYGYADIIDHLKPALNKGDGHHMENIDFIYMINLDQRPKKWERSNQQLNPYGIYPYRFSAVNGWELTYDDLCDVGLKWTPQMLGGYYGTIYGPELEAKEQIIAQPNQVYFCHCFARGSIGIVLSHLSVLYDALQSGYETIWVMEDDIEVLSNPNEISLLIEKLDRRVGKNGWDVLFTDRNTRNNLGQEVPAAGMAKRPNFIPKNMDQYFVRRRISRDFIQIGARFGAYSMVVRRSGIEKIFNFILAHSIFFPYDMDFHLPEGIRFFTPTKNIVGHLLNATSDNGGPNYLNKD